MSVHEEKPPKRELRNSELVSRLLAATPPYLYGALPLQPHAFFFSEMLRSFVAARQHRPHHRRFKRRRYFAEDPKDAPHEAKDREPQGPLELTVDKEKKEEEDRPSSFVDVGTEDLAKSARSPELILPPPPPMWYPPIYNPSFGVDPLNLFIDLRVSGQIYDRKREETDKDDGRVKEIRSRHLSAFSVPVRSGETFDRQAVTGKGTSYIMRNLKRVYEDVHTARADEPGPAECKDESPAVVDDDDVVD